MKTKKMFNKANASLNTWFLLTKQSVVRGSSNGCMKSKKWAWE